MPYSPERLKGIVKTKKYEATQEVINKIATLSPAERASLLHTVNQLLKSEKGSGAKKAGIWILLEMFGPLGATQVTHSLSESQVYLRLEEIKRHLEGY